MLSLVTAIFQIVRHDVAEHASAHEMLRLPFNLSLYLLAPADMCWTRYGASQIALSCSV
ncbi:hypothetical protein Pmar_PMAR014481 [Perkinsus marinus ATCC 50983]|uniref:Uncharacterized protein n=1 Tax=Perkinsus marinus (strain ATCC 50983 / TXsc) TaxID=423536 RepID=C5KM20_PERM5|nr:hypothetical protein Pmar_PMAR014481 [Perkinsus marinus ATCC 50983]EER14473.1 hypothetical protein Pmar_PMAR014481 [Perkinsus marinus ATCC 50983]|eukprot:XP_002782678.1 hypothetical protein Pmar_PMAR014481 [Perkinsus marinus ATCC 50983]